MFTGIVRETGEVMKLENSGEGKRITVRSTEIASNSEIGDSVNVSGACLTIEEITDSSMKFFLAKETIQVTWFDNLEEGDYLNLEPSLRPTDKMGGHQVQGHVEAIAKVLNMESMDKGWNFTFELPEKISNYVVQKGFITVEGISLTTTEVGKDEFSVTIIPETWNKTNLSDKEEGDLVNLESDPIGRYVEKMVENDQD